MRESSARPEPVEGFGLNQSLPKKSCFCSHFSSLKEGPGFCMRNHAAPAFSVFDVMPFSASYVEIGACGYMVVAKTLTHNWNQKVEYSCSI